MRQIFDYFETVSFTATVCDKDGAVVYQNARARENDGDAAGRNIFECHNEQSAKMIRHMLATGKSHTMESIRNGKRRLLHRTPWLDENGEVAGLIELGLDLPDDYPVIDYDKR